MKYPPRPFRLLEQAGQISIFFYKTLLACRRGLSFDNLNNQIYKMGVESVPLILITGMFTGMVLSAQTFNQLNKMGASTMVGPIVGVGMVESLGPILAALMMSSRVGGAMAAELGTMQVSEQVDAMRVFGADPIRYLVAPRFLACILVMPLLTLLADLVGMMGGYFVSVKIFGIDSHLYVEATRGYMNVWRIFSGVSKSFFFGGIIAIFCCWRGMVTQQGAEGVGRATTQASVLSAIGILISNFFLTLIMNFISRNIIE